MFEFLKRKKVYTKTNFSTFGFEEPSIVLNNSHINRHIKLGDISFLNKEYGVREINDNGLKSYASPYEGDDKSILEAKYGYSLNYDGITFHDNIIEALTEYSRKRDDKIAKHYHKVGNNFYQSYQGMREVDDGISISVFDTSNQVLSMIMDTNGYPIPLDFIQEYTPLYFGKNILNNDNYIFMYKQGVNNFISYFPRISHGAFYIDEENIIRHNISNDLTSIKHIELITAGVEKSNKDVLSITNKGDRFIYDNWKQMYIYNDDIFHYNGYREYKQQSISINRDRKLSQLLDI